MPAFRRELGVATNGQRLGSHPRFSAQALEKWWALASEHASRQDSNGIATSVTHREFAAALKTSPELLSLLKVLLTNQGGPEGSPTKHGAARQIRTIVCEMAWNHNDLLDFAGFLKTFQKRGMLMP